MRANYKIPKDIRCPTCLGWAEVLKPGRSDPAWNHGLPLGHEDYEKCPTCNGTGRKENETLQNPQHR